VRRNLDRNIALRALEECVRQVRGELLHEVEQPSQIASMFQAQVENHVNTASSQATTSILAIPASFLNTRVNTINCQGAINCKEQCKGLAWVPPDMVLIGVIIRKLMGPAESE
jgi:hypothetical protein